MKNLEKFIIKYKGKYKGYGEKRLTKIYETARKFVRLSGKQNRKYMTLNNQGEIVEKFYSIPHEAEKVSIEFLKLKNNSELQGFKNAIKKDYRDVSHYVKYYKYRRRLELQKDDGIGENFVNRYGKETYNKDGEEKTINQWLVAFRKNEISQDELNEIINEFKKTNESYLSHNRKKGFYK